MTEFLNARQLGNSIAAKITSEKRWQRRQISVQRKRSRSQNDQSSKEVWQERNAVGYSANWKNRLCIIDDESYFSLAHTYLNENDRFYTSDFKSTPTDTKYRPMVKFQKKNVSLDRLFRERYIRTHTHVFLTILV